jgi:TPR repeat protein
MRFVYARLLRAALMASAMLAAVAGAAGAGPLEDAAAAEQRGEYASAYLLLRPLPDNGDAFAQSALGFFYAEGRGVPQDYVEAVKWFRKAAVQGDATAQYNVGLHTSADTAHCRTMPKRLAGIVSLPIRAKPMHRMTSASYTPTAKGCRRTTLKP